MCPATTFEDLVAEAEAADVSGWDFGWLDGRATEQRPSWSYHRQMGERLTTASAALDIQTGGGEVLATATTFPPTMVATEAWSANLAAATRVLHPLGVVVVASPHDAPLPFADDAFDLVTSRHPARVAWSEIARVLRPGGTYFAQHVGPESARELYEFFLGPQPDGQHSRHPDRERADAAAAGLRVRTLRLERLRMEFYDVGAVVYFLRKVVWTVPDFTVDRYRSRLRDLHDRIRAEGSFVTQAARMLVEAELPGYPRT